MRRALAMLLGAVILVALVGTAAAGPSATVLNVQRLGFCGGDDWEPAVATAGSHAYVLITHFVGSATCDSLSASNGRRIMIQVSGDGGKTFAPPRVVSDTPGGIAYTAQADPAIAVDQSTGAVYVSFLAYGINGGHTDVYVAKSNDAGATFLPAVRVNSTDCKNCDHEKVVAGGGRVYLAYGQAQHHFVAVSLDAGATFVQRAVDSTDVVSLAEAGALDGSGNAWFAWADCQSGNCTGTPAVDYRVSETMAGGTATTYSPVIAQSPQGPDCPFRDCGFAYIGAQDALAIDSAGALYLAWQDGQVHSQRKSPPVIELSTCSHNCLTAAGWTSRGRVDDKNASGCPNSSCWALFPSLVATGSGQLSATWMDDRNDALDGTVDQVGGWNLWLRTSLDGGSSWSGPGRRISRYDPNQAQSRPGGFLFPYGDYTGLSPAPACGNSQVAITWGEGQNWAGGADAPGHVEYASAC